MLWFQNVLKLWIAVLEFLNMPRLHKVWMIYFMTIFWIRLIFWIWQGLNILGLHKILNKILHHGYFTGLWICFKLWICQCYTGLCRKRPIINVWQESEYSAGYQYVTAWVCKGCECVEVTQDSVQTVF